MHHQSCSPFYAVAIPSEREQTIIVSFILRLNCVPFLPKLISRRSDAEKEFLFAEIGGKRSSQTSPALCPLPNLSSSLTAHPQPPAVRRSEHMEDAGHLHFVSSPRAPRSHIDDDAADSKEFPSFRFLPPVLEAESEAEVTAAPQRLRDHSPP